ncbi:glycosyltransferase family 4 protein [Parendozoicomonas sp. Alg238-R29]|uniref:glycosyltransferase family 4 protein n=1 Tax=Parendozoicomonas sp. Alg238-R29 TaxID=2993446 RepID=UPI00248EDAE6|nr:glycosyltransferase family 4 protein [Parendozoicomonas sp. Alg238-R29]
MIVLYIHQYFGTPSHPGGTRSYEMAKRLVRNGHEVHMVTMASKLSEFCVKKKGWEVFNVEGIRVHAYHLTYSNKMGFSKRIIKFFQFVIASMLYVNKIKSDVVFATSTPLTVSIPAVIYSKKNDVPMVFEVRDLWPELPIAIGALKSRLSIFLAKKLEFWSYSNSSRIIGLSPGMVEGVVKCGFPRNKTAMIPNSCDTDVFSPFTNDGCDEIFDFLNGRKLAVYTGTLGNINGVSYFAELACKVSRLDENVCFVIFGDGMECDLIKEKSKQLGVYGKNFYMFPKVNKSVMPKILAHADVAFSLFLPIREMWNNSANKFFDALASETPVVINYGGWQADLFSLYPAGISVDPYDIDLAAVEFLEFIKDEGRIASAKIAARKLAQTDFNRDVLAVEFERVLSEAVNEAGSVQMKTK